jgi:hypothetical protein
MLIEIKQKKQTKVFILHLKCVCYFWEIKEKHEE